MKRVNQVLVLFLIVLSGCEGSDTYQGNWKATDEKGNKFDITFSPKSFSIKDSTGGTSDFEYKQHSVEINNFVETYGISLDDGRNYIIHFPIASTESKSIIGDGNGKIMYTISRDEYLIYDDLHKLK